MSTFKILLKREFWENRGGFLWTPIVLSTLFILVVGLTLTVARLKAGSFIKFDGLTIPIGKAAVSLGPDQIAMLVKGTNETLAGLSLMAQIPLAIVVFFYLLGSLFDDRKDRSILFWKSMPVSDLNTILSKIVSATLVAPLITLGVLIVTHIAVLGIMSALMASLNVNPWSVMWTQTDLFGLWLRLLVGIPVNFLWTLPALGWLMMVSSWARGFPFLWAVFTPIGIGLTLSLIEVLSALQIPQTWYYINIFGRGVFGILPWSFNARGGTFGFEINDQNMPSDIIGWQAMGDVFSSPHLWLGILAGLAMLAVAFYFRRYKELAD
ncbi:hypothetical protein C7S18_14085 [Ahniella affigens]|uniref:Uncharacterized protein n=1 Tax=Ahniella affigens TaxID=2021234 RepID=A0A2P1PTV4_9GAMM|nr:hypothetical protein [Ahniella affigens]AVP98252.1 hypothetical protein C7S18_14085 [Ahniella affigens]